MPTTVPLPSATTPRAAVIVPLTSPVRTRRLDTRRLDAVLLGGLAGVFLVNALVAVLQPEDFTNLVGHSVMGRMFPVMTGTWMAALIGVNDLLLGLCLGLAVRVHTIRAVALAWAGSWLLAVTVIKVTSLHVVGG